MDKKERLELAPMPAVSIPDMLSRMEGIAAVLKESDGIACFNRLYMVLMRVIGESVKSTDLLDPEFTNRLHVELANLYFIAVTRHTQGLSDVARSWLPLFSTRMQIGIPPLRFAIAGLSSHINYNLCIAIYRLCQERGVELVKGSDQHRDFVQIGEVVSKKMAEIRERFLSTILRRVESQPLKMDDPVSAFDIVEARNLAWDHAELIWVLRGSPPLVTHYLSLLDRGVTAASRTYLIRR